VRRIAFLFAFVLTLFAAPASAATPMRLRVLSFNTWSVPWISDQREARVRRVGQAIAELAPDVVALQEVWTDEDARSIAAALATSGLPHVRYFASSAPVGFGSAGLLIASVHPLADVAYQPFTLGARPHTPWHLDWVASKGVIRARIDTPIGALTIANTHLQASYRTGNYVPVRIGQMLQISDFVGAFGVHSAAGTASLPVILVGDLNATPSALEFQLLETFTGLRPAAPQFDIDAVLYRPGNTVTLRPLRVSEVLDTPIDLGGGTHERLSDHPGILVDFELSACEGCNSDRETPVQPWRAVAASAAAVVRTELDLCETQARWSLRIGVASLPLAAASFVGARRRLFRRRRSWWGLGGVLLVSALWLLYFALGYAPGHLAGLDHTRHLLLR
jgi:endonuclease/exonuclease/phosphatase family metal-dependent hydrolase